MLITEKHCKAIELIVEGRNITDVAKIIGVERKTIYNWLEKAEFKVELHKRKQCLKLEAEERLDSRLNQYIEELHNMAMCGKSEKIKHDSLCYLVDRILGKPTSKVINIEELEQEVKDKVIDIDNIIQELDVKEA